MLRRPAGGTLLVSLATLAGQFIAFATLPVLSRMYTPSEFGSFSVLLAIGAVLAPVAMLRLDQATLLPTNDRELRSIILAACFSALLISLAATLILIIVQAENLLNIEARLIDYVATGGVTYFAAMTLVLTRLLLRDSQYLRISGRTLLQSLLINTLPMGFAAVPGRGFNGLLIGNAAGVLVAATTLLPSNQRYFKWTSWSEIRHVIRKYWRFPVVFAPTSLAQLSVQQAPLIIVSAMFGAAVGGQLGMAERLASLPVSILGMAIGSTIEAEFSRHIREAKGGFQALFVKYSGVLALAGIGILVGFALAGQMLTEWFLGSEWKLAGSIIVMLGPLMAIRMVAHPLRRINALFQRARATVVLEVAKIGILAAAVAYTFAFELDVLPTLTVLFVALGIGDVANWAYSFAVVRTEDRRNQTA